MAENSPSSSEYQNDIAVATTPTSATSIASDEQVIFDAALDQQLAAGNGHASGESEEADREKQIEQGHGQEDVSKDCDDERINSNSNSNGDSDSDNDNKSNNGSNINNSNNNNKQNTTKKLEQDFVDGMVENILPFVAACDKQSYAVAASQDALLHRIKYLQTLLDSYTNENEDLIPSLSESTRKIRETRTKLASINSRLSAIHTRLSGSMLKLHASLPN